MLLLSRKAKQRLFIDLPSGERITVVLVETRGAWVTLGIDAPKEFVIRREEAKPLEKEEK